MYNGELATTKKIYNQVLAHSLLEKKKSMVKGLQSFIIKVFVIVMSVVAAYLLVMSVGLTKELSTTYQRVESLQATIVNQSIDADVAITKMDGQVTTLADQVMKYQTVVSKQNTTIEKLIAENKTYKTLAHRKYLYDNYKYALVNSMGNRTGLTYDQLEYGIKLAKKQGINPNVLFAIGMVESGYRATAKSAKSTASGYHQLLHATAVFSYETLLKNGKGTFRNSYVYDPKTNIAMAAAYLGNLRRKTPSLAATLNWYSGTTGGYNWYTDRMNSFLKQVGTSVEQISANEA